MDIRSAEKKDYAEVCTLIGELCRYLELGEAKMTPEILGHFLDKGEIDLLIADEGGIVGFVLLYHTFSTLLAKQGLYVEDLYVSPKHRGKGIGLALIEAVKGWAKEKGYGRIEWCVPKWNEKAIAFYEKMGAKQKEKWISFRLDAF